MYRTVRRWLIHSWEIQLWRGWKTRRKQAVPGVSSNNPFCIAQEKAFQYGGISNIYFIIYLLFWLLKACFKPWGRDHPHRGAPVLPRPQEQDISIRFCIMDGGEITEWKGYEWLCGNTTHVLLRRRLRHGEGRGLFSQGIPSTALSGRDHPPYLSSLPTTQCIYNTAATERTCEPPVFHVLAPMPSFSQESLSAYCPAGYFRRVHPAQLKLPLVSSWLWQQTHLVSLLPHLSSCKSTSFFFQVNKIVTLSCWKASNGFLTHLR